MKINPSYSNAISLFVLSLVWGSSYILMKKGLVSFTAIQVGMLRIVFAALVLLPFVPKAIKQAKRRDIKFILLVAFLGSGLPTYLYPLAITKIDSSVAGIINSLTPLFTMLFGWLLYKAKPTIFKFIGLFFAFIGAGILIVNFNNLSTLSEILNKFVLVAVLATICYGLSSNILKEELGKINALELTSLSFFVLSPVALTILYFSDVGKNLHHEAVVSSLSYIFILGAVGTAAALVLFNKLIQRTNAVFATSVTYFIPIVALLWGVIDGESIDLRHLFGIVFIVSGVYISNKKVKVK